MRKSADSTLHDVAARVGVSTRTVSRVVNREGGFSAATEAKVRAAIAELGYRPNLLARGLITKRTNTIGVIGGSMLDPFFPELAEGVQRAGQERGLTMFFASSNDEVDRQQQALDSFISRAVDGIIAFPAAGRVEPLLEVVAAGVNLVVVNPPSPHDEMSSISSDIEAGARLAVEHLRDRGRSRIAFLGNRSPTSFRREAGFRQGVGDDDARVHEADPTAPAAMAAMAEILQRWPDIDGLVTYNDIMAMGAMRTLAGQGRSVPDDISVVGFDNIALSAYLAPSLTTIDLHQMVIGATAVAMIDEMFGDAEPGVRHVVHPVELVVRESTGG